MAHRLANQPRSAKEQLEKAIQLKPDLAEICYQLGRIYRQLGEAGRASEALAKFNSRKAEEVSEERQLAADVAREVQ